jgi:hypothetical protein
MLSGLIKLSALIRKYGDVFYGRHRIQYRD